MLQRIKIFIDAQNLSSSAFANEIGVQRSSVSHVLSGRNKPSLDFIIKIKERYPDVNLDWLLSGKGGMISAKLKSETVIVQQKETDTIDPSVQLKQESLDFDETASVKKDRSGFDENQILKDEAPPHYGNGNSNEKKLKKIILLYHDNSFEEFKPEK